MTVTEDVFSGRATVGATLRKAREERALTVDEVATQLNLTTTRISQIEEGTWQQMPCLTFARGYLRLYARFLELDAEALVEQFNQETEGLVEQRESPLHATADLAQRQSFSGVRLLSLIFLIVFIIGGFLWWEENTKASKEQPTTEELGGSLELEPSAEVGAKIDWAAVEDSPVAEAQNNVAEDEVVAAAGDEAPQDNQTEQTSAEQTSEPVSEQASGSIAVASNEGRLNFEFSADCWLQVQDGAGKLLYSGILGATDTLELSGVLPLELRIGNAAAIKLRYNDVPVDIEPSVRRMTFGS